MLLGKHLSIFHFYSKNVLHSFLLYFINFRKLRFKIILLHLQVEFAKDKYIYTLFFFPPLFN